MRQPVRWEVGEVFGTRLPATQARTSALQEAELRPLDRRPCPERLHRFGPGGKLGTGDPRNTGPAERRRVNVCRSPRGFLQQASPLMLW